MLQDERAFLNSGTNTIMYRYDSGDAGQVARDFFAVIKALSSVNGLTATYFDNIDFTAQVMTRIDPQIEFDGGNYSPDPRIAADSFSVRWTGYRNTCFTSVHGILFYSIHIFMVKE